MVRTRFRADQGIDEEFLTEQEGADRFVFREGYGTNNANVIIDSSYFVEADRFHVDGYTRFTDLINDPSNALPSNSLYLYDKNGNLFTKNSSGKVKQLSDILTVSETGGGISVSEVTEIEFNDAYGFNVVDAGNGKVRIDFGSAFNPLYVDGQDTLDAAGEEPLEIIAGYGIDIQTNISSNPKSITFATNLIAEGDFSPVVKIGSTPQTMVVAVGKYTKVAKMVAVTLTVSFYTSGSGELSIEGLPYISDPTANLNQVFVANVTGVGTSAVYGAGVDYGSGIFYAQKGTGDAIQGILYPNTSKLFFVKNDLASNITSSILGTSVTINLSGTYITT